MADIILLVNQELDYVVVEDGGPHFKVYTENRKYKPITDLDTKMLRDIAKRYKIEGLAPNLSKGKMVDAITAMARAPVSGPKPVGDDDIRRMAESLSIAHEGVSIADLKEMVLGKLTVELPSG